MKRGATLNRLEDSIAAWPVNGLPATLAGRTRKVYDRLAVNKGPSLGAEFTLACPYTLLAHYNELPFAAENHIEANLIRVSAGGEDTDDLIARFEKALKTK